MKRKLLFPSLALVLVLSLGLVMAEPAMAWWEFNTSVSITGPQEPVEPGTLVKLTITETNTSDTMDGKYAEADLWISPAWVMLYPPYPGGLELTSADVVSGDSNNPGVLDYGETWVWEVDVLITEETTFEAIGHGLAQGNWYWDVTWDVLDDLGAMAFPNERAVFTVYVTPPPDECEPCEGGVTELTLQYNGATTANIVVTDKKGKNVLFSGSVGAGVEFSFEGMDKKGKMGSEIKVYVTTTDNGEELTKIHTSCSQPIGVGSIFGDFEVTDGASLKGGQLCPIGSITEPEPEECGECKGGVIELTLQYNGTAPADIVVKAKKKNVTLFDAEVAAGGTFTFIGADKHGKMGSEIKISVNGGPVTKIHTSCSQPIGIGMVFGDFVVIDGWSHKGGQFCSIP